MIEKIEEIVRNVGNALIEKYAKGDCVVGGVNGPYDDPETKIRNLSHLAIICCIEIIKYKKYEYKRIVSNIAAEIFDAQELDGLYIMREKKGKDQCNGVIGHAWLNEALVYIFKVLGDRKYLELAKTISEQHQFDYAIGLWERPNDGDVDYTMNHQLWYAASLVELNELLNSSVFARQVNCFMSFLKRNFMVNKKGRIRHSVWRHKGLKETFKQNVKNVLSDIHERKKRPSMAYKECGYHVFNLMALARIYAKNCSFDFFKSKKFLLSLEYLNNKLFIEGLLDSKIDLDSSLKKHACFGDESQQNVYGFPYNVPGFELAYVNMFFSKTISGNVCLECMKKQIDLTYDFKKGLFGKRCHDKRTINYRVYEYYRFLELKG